MPEHTVAARQEWQVAREKLPEREEELERLTGAVRHVEYENGGGRA